MWEGCEGDFQVTPRHWGEGGLGREGGQKEGTREGIDLSCVVDYLPSFGGGESADRRGEARERRREESQVEDGSIQSVPNQLIDGTDVCQDIKREID